MKRYLTYILLIISSICYGQIYSTANSNIQYNGFQSSSYYNQPIRGYNTINYNTQRIGYTTKTGYSTYKGTYNPYNKSYNKNNYYGGCPRRSPGRPDPNNSDSVGDDWRMNNNHSTLERIWGYFTDPDYESYNKNWPYLINDDYWDEFMAKYGDTEYGEYARKWYENRGLPFPGDPFADPVGEFPISLLLICAFGYAYYKKYKNDKQSLQKQNK